MLQALTFAEAVTKPVTSLLGSCCQPYAATAIQHQSPVQQTWTACVQVVKHIQALSHYTSSYISQADANYGFLFMAGLERLAYQTSRVAQPPARHAAVCSVLLLPQSIDDHPEPVCLLPH